MRFRAGLTVAVSLGLSLPSVASAQQAAPPPSAIAQVIGMFAQACLQFAGRPDALRAFMKAKGAKEMGPSDRTIFMRGRPGVVFNASTPSARLAVASQDDGACSAFLGSGDGGMVASALHAALRDAHASYEHVSDDVLPTGPSSVDRLRVGARDYVLVTSANSRPDAPIRAAITLAPKGP